MLDKYHRAYKILKQKEFSNDPKQFLHKNQIEEHLTLGGVYEKFHKDKIDWHFVHNVLKICDFDLIEVNKMEKERNKLKDTFPLHDAHKAELQEKIKYIESKLELQNKFLKRASVMLFNDNDTRFSVAMLFKNDFWDKCRLDEVQSQKMCNEIFLSAVHIGVLNACKLAQKQVKVLQDGIIGNITIKALNRFDENRFDTEFDDLEIEYYQSLYVKNPKLKMNNNGFVSRAESV